MNTRSFVLSALIAGTASSVRPDAEPCIACHNTVQAGGDVRLDDLDGKQDFIDLQLPRLRDPI